MQVNIKATGLELTSEIRSYVDKKTAKLEKYLKGESAALLWVELEQLSGEDAQFRAEFTLQGGGFDLRSEAREGTLHAAIDATEERLSHELSQLQGKKERLFRRSARRMKDFFKGFGKN